MRVHITTTGVVVLGKHIDDLARDATRDPGMSHVKIRSTPATLILMTHEEFAQLSGVLRDTAERVCDNLDLKHIIPVGIGSSNSVFYLVIIWNAGQLGRKQLGLPPKHFYVQLSEDDDVSIERSYHTLMPRQFPTEPSLELFEHLVFSLSLHGDTEAAFKHAIEACSRYPDSEKAFLRLADLAFASERWKLAMLSYGQTHSMAYGQPRILTHSRKRIKACASHTEIGVVCFDSERESLPRSLVPLLTRLWQSHTIDDLSTLYETDCPTLCVDSRERLVLPVASTSHSLPEDSTWSRLPRFLRWVVPFSFALMSTPRDAEDVALLAHPLIGIRHIITLTEECPLDRAWFTRLGFQVKNTFLAVPNYQAPSIEQMDIILRICADNANGAVLVHCGGGKGRAGTVAACYLAAFGFSPAHSQVHRESPAMDSGTAIAALRNIRPGSVETSQQEAFVQRYISAMWKRQSVLPVAPDEPAPCKIEVHGTLPQAMNIDMLMLVGLPGSGKTWFAQSIVKRDPDKWIWHSQDEIGGRAGIEAAVGRNSSKSIILDRCNSSSDDRRWFLKLADTASTPLRAVCVWFDYSSDLCTWRAQNRTDHPTLPPGGRVRAAVKQMQDTLANPAVEEGFSAVVIVRSFNAANELVHALCAPAGLLKFPRTSHLINLGAATTDDVISSVSSAHGRNANTDVVITEKVDGANMGFSLAADRTTILTQNRSHYVNPASHEQFRRLGSWIERHRAALLLILDRDTMFPERFILYGEWLSATHSILYSKLPGLFMAFDLYDRANRMFVDRSTLEGLLHGSDIPLTPLVYRGTLPDEQRLTQMACEPSLFYDGPREGIYVKWERGGRVVERSKIVRADFISGNEHWTKGIIRQNTVVDYDA